jgi:hypothetical protein
VIQSAFVDCPAGDLNIIIKNIQSANKHLFTEHTVIRICLQSSVRHKKILIPNFNTSQQVDEQFSQTMINYSKKSAPEDEVTKVLMNHVVNLIARHFDDKIVLQII